MGGTSLPGPARRGPDAQAPAGRDYGILVGVLAMATGAMDAIGFLGLGGVFTSVMTGNMILLGLSAGHRNGTLAAHSGVALAGFALGAVAGSRTARRSRGPGHGWHGRVTAALAIEAGVLAAVTAAWEVAAGRPGGTGELLMLAAAAMVMGIQSAAIRGLGVPGLSTTYMTGTLTAVLADLAAARNSAALRRGAGVLLMLILGAATGGVLVVGAPRLAPLVPLLLLLGVVASAVVRFPGRR